MTLQAALVAFFWTGLLLFGVPRMRKYWRGEPPADIERNLRMIWPYGEAALQGWLRALSTFYIAGWFTLFGYLALVLYPFTDPAARRMVALVTLAGAVVAAGMASSIILFNRPKRIVFPALRDQEGLLTRWWRLRRDRPPADERSSLS